MTSFRLDLVSNAPLILSSKMVEDLSKTLQKHGINVLEKKLNKALRLRIGFERRRKNLMRKKDEYHMKATQSSIDTVKAALFKDMLKAIRAEISAISEDFLLTIEREQMTVEVNFSRRVSKMTTFYVEVYFNKIISNVCETYAEVGQNVYFYKKAA